jgi:hypothetical protein
MRYARDAHASARVEQSKGVSVCIPYDRFHHHRPDAWLLSQTARIIIILDRFSHSFGGYLACFLLFLRQSQNRNSDRGVLSTLGKARQLEQFSLLGKRSFSVTH